MNLGLDYSERVFQSWNQSIWQWLQRQPALLRYLVLLVLYVTLGLLLNSVVPNYPGAGVNVQPWDPATGLHILLLFGFGFRYAPAIFLVPFLQGIFQAPTTQLSYLFVTLSALYTCLGYSGAAFFLLHQKKIDPRLRSLNDVFWFTGVFLGTSIAISGLSLLTQHVMEMSSGYNWSQEWLRDWSGESNGIMVLTTPCLILMRSLPWSNQRLTLQEEAPQLNPITWLSKHPVKRLNLIGFVGLAAWLAYGRPQGVIEFSYITFIPIVWIAIRYGFRKTTLYLLVLNIAAVVFSGNKVESDSVFVVQLGLLTVTTVGALLGAYVTDHRTESDRRQRLEYKLRYQANHDSLTGLYNRNFLSQQLEKIANRIEENPANRSVLFFIDIDRFKDINDSLGHLVGDRLLALIADRIRDYLANRSDSKALACRFGGDEFVVLLNPNASTQITQRMAKSIARSLCDCLAEAYEVDDYRLQTTASVGIAFSDLIQTDSDDLLRNADIALYEAKMAGRGQCVIFDRRMYEELVARSQLESDLSEAVLLLEDYPLFGLPSDSPSGPRFSND